MLPEKLKTENYYLEKLSLFMRDSYGIEDHFSMLITILDFFDRAIDDVLYAFNITNDDVFLWLESLDVSETECDILDKIAHLYGMSRNFKVTYNEGGTDYTEQLDLSNFELWILIKAQILQQCFNGTYAEVRAYYDKMKLPITILSSNVISQSAQAVIYLNTTRLIEVGGTTREITQNIIKMYKANLLTIRSMGITYLTSTSSLENIGIWDSADVSRSWDKARWGI